MSAIILSRIEELEAEQRSASVLAHLYRQAMDSDLVVELPHIQEAVEHLIANPVALPEVTLTTIPEHWGLEEARRDEAEANRLHTEIRALQARASQLMERAHLLRERNSRQVGSTVALTPRNALT